MSTPTNWAKLCRYSAMANVLAIMVFAAALMRFILNFTEENQGADISPSIVSYGGVYHLPFLFVAIITLLLCKRMPKGMQQGLIGLNTLMALYTFVQVAGLLAE